MNEEAATIEHLVEYLEADTTLQGLLEGGVWTSAVAETARFPVVKIDREDSEDLQVFGTSGPIRVWADITFLIRGVVHWTGGGHPDWTTPRAIGDRLDALLQGYSTTTSAVALKVFREESFTEETVVEEGDLFLQVGGVYRVRAQAV